MMEAASSQSVANDTRDFIFFQFCNIKKLTQKNSQKIANLIKLMHFSQKLPNIFCHEKIVMDCYLGPSHHLIANGK